MAMDRAEREDTLKTINSTIEELGCLYDWLIDDKDEPELARHIDIAQVALIIARGKVKQS